MQLVSQSIENRSRYLLGACFIARSCGGVEKRNGRKPLKASFTAPDVLPINDLTIDVTVPSRSRNEAISATSPEAILQ
jgi:hypothetical protein